MDPLVAGAASAGINAIGSIASNLFGQKMSYKNNVKLMNHQNNLARENAVFANNMAIANWQMENEYNTPANQMKRLQEAGLNPNLVYGNGADATAGQIGKVGAPQAPNAPYQDYQFGLERMGSDALRAYQQAQQIDIQDKLAQSQVDYQNAQTANTIQDTINKQTANAGMLISNDHNMWRYNYDQEMRDVFAGTLRAQLAGIEKNTEFLNARIDETNANTALLGSKAAETNANIELIQARTGLTREQAVVARAQINLIVEQSATEHLRANGIRISNRENSSAYELRIQALQQSLAESLRRTEHYGIRIDLDRARQRYQQIVNSHEARINEGSSVFGITPTTNLNQIPSAVINDAAVTINRLFR